MPIQTFINPVVDALPKADQLKNAGYALLGNVGGKYVRFLIEGMVEKAAPTSMLRKKIGKRGLEIGDVLSSAGTLVVAKFVADKVAPAGSPNSDAANAAMTGAAVAAGWPLLAPYLAPKHAAFREPQYIADMSVDAVAANAANAMANAANAMADAMGPTAGNFVQPKRLAGPRDAYNQKNVQASYETQRLPLNSLTPQQLASLTAAA